MATLAERDRDTEAVQFHETHRAPTDERIDKLAEIAGSLAASASSLASTTTKLLFVAIVFVSLWGLEVIFRIQRIIERW
jgi:hypothetical protein